MSSEDLTNDKLTSLREALASHLLSSDRLKTPEGLTTGHEDLDRFLFWHGLPKGALSLFRGPLGTGATSLWIETAARTLAQGRWVAWVNRDVPLSPLPLQHKGMNLGHFVSIEKPQETSQENSKSEAKLFWLLQELMSSSLFDLIGCDLGDTSLREHQLRKLQKQARDQGTALVFLSSSPDQPLRGSLASLFSLVVGFGKKELVIERALHRQTPHSFDRRVTYARFTQHSPNRLGTGATEPSTDDEEREPYSLLEAASSLNGGLASGL